MKWNIYHSTIFTSNQSPSWQANSRSTFQEISSSVTKYEGLLQRKQEPAIGLYSDLFSPVIWRILVLFSC